jgi:cell division protein FtsW
MSADSRAGGSPALRAGSTAVTAWLRRPLTSFHLLLAVFGLLTAIGLAMVLSATTVASYASDGHSVYALFEQQAVFVLVGLAVFWAALRLDLALVRKLAPAAMIVAVLLLAAVLVVGDSRGGSRSWFDLGPVSVQPVELAKLSLALWGAHVLVAKKAVLRHYRHLLVPVVPVTLLLCALLMLQPDLGSTVSLVAITAALLWFSDAPGRLFAAMTAGGIGGLLLLSIGARYRMARVVSFLNPLADKNGSGFQALQAKYALAGGGLFGQGLGQGSSKWHYLPNLHTDFIFALIGQELGLLGALVVLGLFAAVAVIGLRIAARNADPWIRLVAGTLTVWVVSQAGINIGYVVGLLPVTGIPLPLISYGGTSTVTFMAAFGLLANCARHEPDAVSALRGHGRGRFGKLLGLPAPRPYQPAPRRKPAPPNRPERGPRTPTARTARRKVHEPARGAASPVRARGVKPLGGVRR